MESRALRGYQEGTCQFGVGKGARSFIGDKVKAFSSNPDRGSADRFDHNGRDYVRVREASHPARFGDEEKGKKKWKKEAVREYHAKE